MSLSLVADYSSSDEEEFVDSDEGSEHERDVTPTYEMKSTVLSQQPRSSLLPSPDDAFGKVTGPPEFLRSRATDPLPSGPLKGWRSATDSPRADVSQGLNESRRGITPAAVIQVKAALVKEPELVRNNAVNVAADGNDTARRVPGVNMPPAEDAAALLRMCLKCGVPKTYSGARESMVCPLCGDRPAVDEKKASIGEAEKRSGSKIKDKEKNKRMKGQSSHATWKSETEMQLRQQFD